MKVTLLGPPGAGKGTNSEELAKRFGLDHISTGAMLRQEAAKCSDLGNEAEEYMSRGDNVPSDLVQRVLVKRVSGAQNGYALDGFPRDRKQAEYLDEAGIGIDIAIRLNISDDRVRNNIMTRWTCKETGKVWNEGHEGFAEEKEKGNLEQRADDINPQSVQRRIDGYKKNVAEIARHYQKQGKLFDIHITDEHYRHGGKAASIYTIETIIVELERRGIIAQQYKKRDSLFLGELSELLKVSTQKLLPPRRESIDAEQGK